ncbi:MAG: hypothetical protein PUC68_03985 [Firmicutes bacterium]|nr:hypothetical protein [Bacillota bacterium]MDY3092071.1 hypothetical protein [Erysipelotrichaceae bacterium]
MKTMFENMLTVIIMVVLLFVFSSIVASEIQIINARKIHTSAISQIQSSYYTVDINEMNNTLHNDYPGWNLKVEKLNSVKSRQDYKVILEYQIIIPVFNIIKEGVIEGYAR